MSDTMMADEYVERTSRFASMEEARAAWDAAHRQQPTKPTRKERAAITGMFEQYERLKRMGWREAIYAPKGTPIEMIEAGSTGIHRGYRDDIGFWIQDGQTWPSRPILFREEPAHVG